MNRVNLSNFMFDLMNEFEVLPASGIPAEWTDNDYDLFKSKYISQSNENDKQIFRYLISTPNLFRCHIPYTKWTLQVASEIVWYYDELIITDPLMDALNNPLPDIEFQKDRIRKIYNELNHFREAVTSGYILFGGKSLTPHRTGKFDEQSNALLGNAHVKEWFEKYTGMGQKPSILNGTYDDGLMQLVIRYVGMWGEFDTMATYIPKEVRASGKMGNELWYDFTVPYTRLTKEDLEKYEKLDLLESLNGEYSKDISVVLETLTNAQSLKTPVLFFRNLDVEIAKQYSLENPGFDKSFVNTTVYDASLPYLEGISPNTLFDVRQQIPNSFFEFRHFLYQLVDKTMKATDDPDEIRARITSEIISMQIKLKTELQSANRKMKIHGVAAPILAVGAGTMTLYSSGLDVTKLIGILIGSGVVNSAKSLLDVKTELNKVQLNPAYFLWTVQNK